MTRSSAEVIIVGAGPAGAGSALLLARAGRDVLMLDRAEFPRAKPCGDCLSLAATALLHRLGLLERVLAVPHARLRGWRIVAPDGGAFEAAFDAFAPRECMPAIVGDCALAVERAVLDQLVLSAALAAGARFEHGTVTEVVRGADGCVTGVRTRTREYHAPVTIGADGLRSVIARRLAPARAGRLRKLSLSMHIRVPASGDIGEMHVGNGLCAGLAPVDEHGRCNLTVVADARRYGRAVAADAHAFACHAVATLPRLRDRLPAHAVRDAVFLASGPFDRPAGRVAFSGAVLVGDAAGYYDPFTGQGVYQALASAELLAPHVDAALRTGNAHAAAFDGYVRARAALTRGPGLVQRGIEMVLSRPPLANRAIGRIRRAPGFARAILAVTGDAAPATALLSPRALSSLIRTATPPENAA